MIFIEKVVIANAEADPIKRIKKNQYLFGVAAQKIWDSIPTGSLEEVRLYETLQEFYKFASQRQDVCVRALLNTGLVLTDHLKSLIPQNKNSLLDIEASIFRLLQEYDPDLADDTSQKVGEEIAANILQHLEKECISQ
jgi:hypothetical protein